MSFFAFLRSNSRWLAGCFLLTYCSSFGQTYFISLSAGEVRAEYGLSHGGFGALYMAATLASALTLPFVGRLLDRMTAQRVALYSVPALAAACLLMAVATHLAVLVLTIYLLRLMGQGMMSQIAFTAAGRWFDAQRGKAMAVTAIGVNAGEATMPFLFVTATAFFGWRGSWLIAAGLCLFVALPIIASLIAVERRPHAPGAAEARPAQRHWTRGEALRDPWFYAIAAGTTTSAMVGTTVFFHTVYLVESRGWSLEVAATSFTVMALTTVAVALLSGQLVDRFSALRMLPTFVIPLGFGCFVLAFVADQWGLFAFMALLGVTYGFSNTVFNSIWPEIYGTVHLGAIRAATVAFGVFGTAAGPGLTGWLIDLGVSLSTQMAFMGVYCFATCGLMVVTMRAVSRRLEQERAAL